MRIAIFCHKFWPAVSGLCTYTGRLAEYLTERGHHVEIFTTRLPRELPAVQHATPRLTLRRYTPRLENHLPFYFMPRLTAEAFTPSFCKADVVHTVGYHFFPSVAGGVSARIRGVAHVSTPVFTLNPTTWQRAAYDRLLGRSFVRAADHVIVQSDHEQDLLRKHGFHLPDLSVVPFGVDADLFASESDVTDLRRRHQLQAGEQVLLFVGKIMAPKGALDCLEAVARVRARQRNARLVMIGEIHTRERERVAGRVRALGLEDAVIFTGPLTDRTEIARYYRLADVVLFPSQFEQFGIVAIEAAASGRPLIGTPVGVMQTLVPRYDGGLLHPFGDIDRFVANLEEVLDNPRYRDNALRHREEVLTTYSWRRIAERTETIYATVAGERRGRR
jgi:D-inositol-3-phosphate glycosyltransferase